jgi:hypothetical protein
MYLEQYLQYYLDYLEYLEYLEYSIMSITGYEVRNINQIDNKNIRLGKTFKYGDKYHLTNIYYLPSSNNGGHGDVNTEIKEKEANRQDAVDDKTKLIIQTPLMFIPNSMVYFNEKPFLELSFNNEENDKDVLAFKKWFTQLEEYIFKIIKRRTSLGINKDNIISCIKAGNGRVSTKLVIPINLNVSKCVLNDDGKRNKILFNWEIPVPTYGISIVWIKNIWVKKDKWGVNLFMYATRVMNSHVLDPVDFLGLDTDNKSIRTVDVINKFQKDEKMSILVGQVPEYTMYFKMLKLGIPKDAVKQKMSLLGIDARIIDYPENAPYSSVLHYISNPQLTYSASSIPPPPPPPIMLLNGCAPPPPPLPLLTLGTNTSRANLLNEISSGGFKLKKVDPKDKILSKLANSNPTGLKVPTLSDIQGALARLKRVELDCTDSDIL